MKRMHFFGSDYNVWKVGPKNFWHGELSYHAGQETKSHLTQWKHVIIYFRSLATSLVTDRVPEIGFSGT